jgi:predicted dehydrogenase
VLVPARSTKENALSGRVRASIIGCGQIAKEHLSVIGRDASIDLAGVCDLSPITAEYTAETYGTKPFTDHREMLDVVRPDVVHVLTPPASHRPIVLDVLEAGTHVICEKPIAVHAGELDGMLDAAEKHGRVLMESQNVRFNDQTLAIERLIANGTLGDVTDVEVLVALDLPNSRFADENLSSPVRGLAGGAIHDFLPHLAYLALHFFGYVEAEAVHARWWNVSGIDVLGYDELLATIAFGAGAATLRFSSHVKPDAFRLIVRGTDATVETDMYNPYFRVDKRRGPAPLSPIFNHAANGVSLATNSARNLRDKLLDRHTTYHGLGRMLERFYASIRLGQQPPITPLEMRRTSSLVDAIVEQAGA